MTGLTMRVRAPAEGAERVIRVAPGEAAKFPGAFMLQVDLIGWDLLPNAEEVAVTYLDDTGKSCKLTQDSVHDALGCALSKDVVSGNCVWSRMLDVFVHAAEKKGFNQLAKDTEDISCKWYIQTSDEVQSICTPDAPALSTLSAVAVTCEPLILGIEAYESNSARGGATVGLADVQVQRFGPRQVFCIGHANLIAAANKQPVEGSSDESSCVPACARFTLMNDGQQAWPMGARLENASGSDLGIPELPLPPLEAGSTTEVCMDLALPKNEPGGGTQHSVWVIRIPTTGEVFGPLIVFKVEGEWQVL